MILGLYCTVVGGYSDIDWRLF